MNINQKYRDNTPSKEKIKQEEEEKQKDQFKFHISIFKTEPVDDLDFVFEQDLSLVK